jgi:tyrosyl-tRNA synthetase
MKKGDGMSYAEFSYPIMQAWDWWTMYQGNEIQMQIGGSDQFGNITAGVDAVKYIAANHPNKDVREEASTRGMPFGFTAPLLTTSSGQKFGKSAGNAIWLDSNQTSSFELYKHFLGTSDADVGRYLKLFTFMPIEQIDALVQDHMRSPQQRKAQHKLAREFVELVHGVEQAKHAESQHRLIFENSMTSEGDAVAKPNLEATSSPSPIQSLTPIEGTTAQVGNLEAHIKLPRSAVEGSNIGRVLLACGLVPSASEGHRLAARGSVHVGGLTGGSDQGMAMIESFLTFTPVDSWSTEYAQKSLIDDKLLILRRGKSHVRIVEVVSDPEYQKLGLSYPGMRIHEEGSRDLKIEGPKLT